MATARPGNLKLIHPGSGAEPAGYNGSSSSRQWFVAKMTETPGQQTAGHHCSTADIINPLQTTV